MDQRCQQGWAPTYPSRMLWARSICTCRISSSSFSELRRLRQAVANRGCLCLAYTQTRGQLRSLLACETLQPSENGSVALLSLVPFALFAVGCLPPALATRLGIGKLSPLLCFPRARVSPCQQMPEGHGADTACSCWTWGGGSDHSPRLQGWQSGGKHRLTG